MEGGTFSPPVSWDSLGGVVVSEGGGGSVVSAGGAVVSVGGAGVSLAVSSALAERGTGVVIGPLTTTCALVVCLAQSSAVRERASLILEARREAAATWR